MTARFDLDGYIHPISFTCQGSNYRVQAIGRQWQASDGRHVLVMTQGEQLFELIFAIPDCRWYLRQQSANEATGTLT